MAGLFFGNRDISVSIKASLSFSFDILNKSILITDEEDIPLQKLNGQTAVAELTTYLTDNTLTAPKLLAGLGNFVGQSDNSGNPVVPEYVYVIGKTEADSSTDVDLITAAIEAIYAENDFYYLVPVFESAPMNTWFQTWGASKRRVMCIYSETEAKVLGDTEKSDRIIGMYGVLSSLEYKNVAWAGRVASYKELIAWKWKQLNGISTDELTDAQVTTLENAGWNGYRKVRGIGETTGSRTTNNTDTNDSHIDTIIIRDNIIYNVAGALHDVFRQSEIVPMGYEGKALISRAISQALNFAGSIGLIEEFENGSYQFSVTVPDVTAEMRDSRTFDGIEFVYVPTIAAEKVTVTGKEILEWITEA